MTVLLNQEEIYTGNLILVNQEYGYRQQVSALSVPQGDGGADFLLEEEAGASLNRLMARIDGWKHIVPVSAWRSLQEQQEIWDQSLEENGLEFTKEYVAFPGHSEHQTGLAIDLGYRKPQIDFIRPDFPYEGICQRFREQAGDYGFVERYPAGKEKITRIGHEPWHFRYVGVPHAAVMAKEGLVLEEYIAFLRGYEYGRSSYGVRFQWGEARISYVRAQGAVTKLEVDAGYPCEISGDNVAGFIITEWRHLDEKQRAVCGN